MEKSENIFQNWFANLFINTGTITRYIYNYWCFLLKNLYFPNLEDDDEEEGGSEEEAKDDVPTAKEVVNNAKNVAQQAKTLAKKKIMDIGAKKLGMNKKDLEKLNKMRKVMKGGGDDQKPVSNNLNPTEMANKAIEMLKELGTLLTLPSLFLFVLVTAITLQIIPFTYIFGSFYDNNIFIGLFMVTLGGIFFLPTMAIGYILKIIYLIIHIFVMPGYAGKGLKLFKHYAKRYKYLWFIIWATITVVSVWYEFRPLGYPYHNIWMWCTGGFGFIIWAWWYGLFKLI